MKNKLVSVIIPSYNHESYIQDSLNSVFCQTYENLEIIVLDDGSKDSSREILKSLTRNNRFELILKENEGLCATLNRGLSLANGEYIVLLASDDLMPINRIKEQVEFLENNHAVDVVAGAINLINENGASLGSKKPKFIGKISFEDMLRRNAVFAPTAMIRKSVYDRVGTYREDYAFEDYYLWLRLLKNNGVIVNTNNIWASYRMDVASFEKKFLWYLKGYKQILSDYSGIRKVKWLIFRAQLNFAIKMALLLGSNIFKKYSNELSPLPWFMKPLIWTLSSVPNVVRQKLLNLILQKV